jgi:hypothetical protein
MNTNQIKLSEYDFWNKFKITSVLNGASTNVQLDSQKDVEKKNETILRNQISRERLEALVEEELFEDFLRGRDRLHGPRKSSEKWLSYSYE